MDEKGFIIGFCNTKRRIVSKKMLEQKLLLGANQDGSREFISLMAAVCADGTALPPALIYAGRSHDLQNTWLEDFDASKDQAYFASSDKGWTNEDLGVSWLQKVFLPHINAKSEFHMTLLIVDGHSSHVNWRFMEICSQNRIVLGILPPHSTHRLQPLDLKIFSPLSTAYSNEIDAFIQRSCGFARLTKRNFWLHFKAAWEKALSTSNIYSAFAAAGISPLNPSKVLAQIEITTPSLSSSDDDLQQPTPGSVRAVRRQIKAVKKTHSAFTAEVELLLRAAAKLSISNEILGYENAGLRKTLKMERKRRKRGQNLGILNKDAPGQAAFASPAKIATLLARRAEEEAIKVAVEEEKEREKASKALEREKKAQEAQERRETRKRVMAEKKAAREQAKEARDYQRRANAQSRAEKQASMVRKKETRRVTARIALGKAKVTRGGVDLGHVRSGRIISRPTRFRD